MSRTDALLGLLCFAGTTLALSGLRAFNREPLPARIGPYLPDGRWHADTADAATALTAVLSPLAEAFGSRLSHLTGIRSDLRGRLAAAGRAQSPSEFRLAQFTHALIAFGAAAMGMLALRPAPMLALVVLVGTPILVALAEEQRLESAVEQRRERAEAELPVVAEQIAVLLAAGMSLGATLDRIATRGDGVVASELGVVMRQVRQGSSETEALRAWAQRSRSEGVDRLVAVLAMHRDAADLGGLLATEARSIRSAAHRRLVESIERRAQLVWVPVTVATLVPGLILIGVPFVSAMTRITG
ncbi:MAG: type II secretion system F family protein [Microthrixaceae bacterium]|nr:type II secretion system F family protein [Microthrixaceae bacterium]